MGCPALRASALALLLALGACADVPAPPLPPRDLPSARILDPQLAAPMAGAVPLEVRRERTGALSVKFRNVQLFVDGQHIADLQNGERVILYVPPGEHLLGVQTQFDPRRTIRFAVRARFANRAAISFNPQRDVLIQRTR
jgi:hypothetical protein